MCVDRNPSYNQILNFRPVQCIDNRLETADLHFQNGYESGTNIDRVYFS